MKKPPAFQFYADDFIGGVSDMTQSEVGAYIMLLCHQWNRGEIPTDPNRASLIAKGKVTDHVLSKFPNGKNARMEAVRAERQAWVEKSSIGGSKSAAIRKGGSTTVQPPSQPKGNTPSPSPINTHTQSDANLPTLAEVQTFADMSGIKPESAKSFYDHHEGNQLWINQHGKLINWKHKLTSWAAKDRQAAKPNDKPTSMMTDKEILAHAIR